MFCDSCGSELPDRASFCSNCGKTMGQPQAHAPEERENPLAPHIGQLIGGEVKARSKDAWAGIKMFAASPVGGLQSSFEMFESNRALGAAIAFTTIYLLMISFGLYKLLQGEGGALPLPLLSHDDLSVKQVSQALLVALTPVATLTVSANLARHIFRGKGTYVGDLYIASASMLPFSMLVLLASFLGFANLELIGILAVFALTYTLLMLYAGCSRISGIPEAGAAPAVPTMLLLTAWLTKVVLTTLVF